MRGTFWSTGQVIMSAVAGIDIALWDLKGKRLGVPVYDLLGGPTREQVRVYRHLAGDTAEELVEDALRWRRAGLHGASLRAARRRSTTTRSPRSWDPQASIVADDRGDRVAARRARRRGRPDPRRAHDVQPAEAAYLGHALEPSSPLLLRGPDPSAQPAVAAAGARQGEPPDRDRRAARAQVGVPAADRGRARRLPAAIDMVHAGGITEAKKILATRRVARAALGASPRELADQRRRLPPCGHGGAELRASRSGWSSEPLYELFPNAPRLRGRRLCVHAAGRPRARPVTSTRPEARSASSATHCPQRCVARRRHASATATSALAP